ncbi:MAG: hypothetical protein ACPLXA_04120 [Moorellaceae bacterium]
MYDILAMNLGAADEKHLIPGAVWRVVKKYAWRARIDVSWMRTLGPGTRGESGTPALAPPNRIKASGSCPAALILLTGMAYDLNPGLIWI